MNNTKQYIASSLLPAPITDAFAYHQRPGALQRLIPPWENVEIEHSDQSIEVGSRVVMKVRSGGLPLRWVAEHTEYDPPHKFTDRQVSGPFQFWLHQHLFQDTEAGSKLSDVIEYRLPFGKPGQWIGNGVVNAKLESMFAYRHRVTQDDLKLQAEYRLEPLQIAISGSSGMVGSQLKALLTLLGHQVVSLVRSPTGQPDQIAAWESEQEAARLSGVDAVIHLAGKPIADQRWTSEVKAGIRDSRVGPTQQLCESLARLPDPPKVLICASATGVYGDRGDELLDEQSKPGDSFLADVAEQWENACQVARGAGIRVVNTRFGIILHPSGGALKQMLLPAKLLGGSLGNGRQWWSWISLDDALGAIYHAIADESLSGPVNLVAPQPIRNRDFAATLGHVVARPALVPAPAFMLRTALGEMADALLLASARVQPAKLIESGYRYRFTDLEQFLRYALGKQRLKSCR